MVKKVNGCECECSCHKGKGAVALVLGLLVLANTYWEIMGWDYFLGIILILAGLCKMIMLKK